MSFPNEGGTSYPQQGAPTGQAPGGTSYQYGQPARSSSLNLGLVLALGITLVALVSYFLSYSSDAAGFQWVVWFLLLGGLVSALRVLPNSPKTSLPIAAVASTVGGLIAISTVIQSDSPEIPGVIVFIMILGILQMLIAIAALLAEHGVLTLPTPKPQYGYGQPAQQAPYAQPAPAGSYGQPAPSAAVQADSGAQGQFAQPTQYTPLQGQFQQPPAGPAGAPGGAQEGTQRPE